MLVASANESSVLGAAPCAYSSTRPSCEALSTASVVAPPALSAPLSMGASAVAAGCVRSSKPIFWFVGLARW